MTREEAIKELEILKEDYWEDDGYGHETKQYGNTMLALDMAIKALEQEPILDNIRAEIEQLPTKARINWDGCCPDFDYPEIEYVDVGKKKLLSIIDKYKTESES